MTTPHRLGGLSNRCLCLTVLNTGQVKVKVLADLVPGENSLHGLQMVFFLLCPHMAERERKIIEPSIMAPSPLPHRYISVGHWRLQENWLLYFQVLLMLPFKKTE